MMKRLFVVLAFGFIGVSQALWAIPTTINYQGTLKEKGLPASGTRNMLFRITSQDGSTVYWSGTQVAVQVTNGLFSAQIAPTLQAGYRWDTITPYMEVSVEGQLLLPREPINATIYAVISGSIVDNAVTTSKLADGAVTTAKLDPAVQSTLIPPGLLVPFAGSNVPSGWLLCDGSAVSRTAYANLFSAIGVTWGAGDGVATFNIPDLRGRGPIGAGQGQGLTNRTLGNTFGEETHQLSVSEIPANLSVNDPGHVHSVTDPGHVHTYLGGAPTEILADSGAAYGAQGGLQKQIVRTGVDSATTGISINSSVTGISVGGGGQPHNTMQPNAVVNFIIKT